MLNIPNLKRVQIPLAGGVDEVSASDSLSPEDAIVMHNWRLSPDGKRIEKRLGLADEATGFASDQSVYGYTTYFNSTAQYCQIAVLEDTIYTKVASGAWTPRHTFTTSLSHPTNVIEAQGKKFVITENGSRMIHYDGNCYQIGISQPTTIPTVEATYTTVETAVVDNHFTALTGWTDDDSGDGASTLETVDPNSTPGPDADNGYLKMALTTETAGSVSQRYHDTATSIGTKYTVEFPVYPDDLGYWSQFKVKVYNGTSLFYVLIDTDRWLYIVDGHDERRQVCLVDVDAWNTLKFSVDATSPSAIDVTCFLNGTNVPEVLGGGGTSAIEGIYAENTANTDRVFLEFSAEYGSSATPSVYIDYFKINNTSQSVNVLEGTHLYAITYVRGGNYGCESRAIKSYIGAVTGDVPGEVTVTGEYANTKSIVVKVMISGTSPDMFKVSYDGGVSYSAEYPVTTTCYLNYGLVLTWATTSSHVLYNSWQFSCDVCTADPTSQEVHLTAIPTGASDPQVTARNIYRTTSGGSTFYYLATINDVTTTTFIDNMPDTMLGELLEEDHYICPDKRFSCWWDDRLWVFDHTECLAYYSRIGEPEHFDTVTGWLAIRRGIPGDDITGVIPYKDSIYVFKPNSIFVIQKNNVLYGVYQANNDVGCVSPWSLIEVNDYLMFRSYRGIEVYDGSNIYQFDFSMPVHSTMNTILNLYNDLVVAAHNKEYNEVWFAFNDRTAGDDVVVVWNYLKNKWYTFGFSKEPSFLSVCRDETKKNVLKMGTRDGYIALCDSGYTDMGTAISATYRKGWLDLEKHGSLRRVDVEYELETGMSVTANIYVDMDKDVFRTYSLAGNSPTSTDAEYRRPIIEKFEVGGRAKWFAIEFINSQQLTAPLKINDCFMYVRQDVHKNKKYAD